MHPDAPPPRIWHELQRWSARVQRAQARTLHEFLALEGPLHLGHARRSDYAETRWEESPQRARVLARVGAACRACPMFDRALREGVLPLSHADLLARRSRDLQELSANLSLAGRLRYRDLESSLPSQAGPPTRAATPDDEWVRVPFRAPAPVVAYLRESLALARALLGHDVSENDALEALLAEASTELDAPASPVALETRSLRRVPPRAAHHPWPTPPPRTGNARRRAHQLDRRLHRLRRLERIGAIAEEEFLLTCLHEGVAGRRGFRRFEDFVRGELRLAPSTAWDRVHRARARRRRDPLALAVQRGLLSPVKLRLLGPLRRFGVSRRALLQWIRFAARHTCRRIRLALSWARHRAESDLRAWAMESWRTPTSLQLQTFTPSLQAILDDPSLPETHAAPHRPFSLELTRGTLEFLERCLAATPALPQSWHRLLHLVHSARTAWRIQIRPTRHPHRRILERDGWACAAPGCTSRRNLEVHHVRFRSRGGGDEDENLLTLCATHHRALVHRGICRVHRDERGRLHWSLGIDDQNRPADHYVDERRVAPRQRIHAGPIRFRHGYCAHATGGGL